MYSVERLQKMDIEGERTYGAHVFRLLLLCVGT